MKNVLSLFHYQLLTWKLFWTKTNYWPHHVLLICLSFFLYLLSLTLFWRFHWCGNPWKEVFVDDPVNPPYGSFWDVYIYLGKWLAKTCFSMFMYAWISCSARLLKYNVSMLRYSFVTLLIFRLGKVSLCCCAQLGLCPLVQ